MTVGTLRGIAYIGFNGAKLSRIKKVKENFFPSADLKHALHFLECIFIEQWIACEEIFAENIFYNGLCTEQRIK